MRITRQVVRALRFHVESLGGRICTFAITVLCATSSFAHGDVEVFTTPGTTSWTVPAGVTQVKFGVFGAEGGRGGGGSGAGGLGGRATALISVVPGQVFQLTVGGAGGAGSPGFSGSVPGAGGFGGGAAGGQTQCCPATYSGGGGGGASDVRTSGGTLADRILVAGGGGGGGGNTAAAGAGGGGGGSSGGGGGVGAPTSSSDGPTTGGDGGSQVGGGAGGNAANIGTTNSDGASSVTASGGVGGESYYSGGGGGGGGYFGGGGGGGGYGGGGGGAGSGFGPDGVDFGNGVESGDGRIVLTYMTVSIDQAAGQSDPTNVSPVSFTVVFSVPVTDFDASDVTLSGTASAAVALVTGGPSTYNVSISATSDGTVIADIGPDAAHDELGNGNSVSTSTDNTITYDTASPDVTIDQVAGQADPTNSSPIDFTLTFSEPVADFTDVDVTLSGTAGATTAEVTGGPITYNVAVGGMTGSGTVVATIAADVAHDAAGNGNTASTSTDNTVTYDDTRPTVTINQATAQGDPTNTGPIHFTAIFNEEVTDFTSAGVTLSGTAGATSAVVSGGPSTYDVAVNVVNNGTVIVNIGQDGAHDASGNGNTASTSEDNTVTFDIIRPTVAIDQAAGQADPASTGPINFTAVFSEAVNDFTGSDVSLSGTAPGTLTAAVTGGPNTYDVAVTGMSGNGTVVASISQYAATDSAGNLNTTSTSSDNTVTFSTGPANLCGNPGFETDLTGWTRYGSGATLSRVPGSSVGGAHGGSHVLQIRSTGDETFGCDDQPNWVQQIATAGTRYRFTAWVKSTNNTSRAKIRVTEQSAGGSKIGSTVSSNEVSLSTTWKLLTATFVVQRAGSSLSMRITESPGSTNKSFLVDDVTIEVVQPAQTFTIVSSAGPGGSITPLGSRSVNSGADQTYTIIANSGYHIDDVKVDNVSIGTPASHTFSNVTANHTIAASFAANPPGANLVGNPDFETDLSGWTRYGSGAALSRVHGLTINGAHGGSYAMQMRSTSTSSFGCDDSPNWVPQVAGAGARYKLTAWVKSLDNTSRVKIRAYELDPNGEQIGSTIYSNEASLSATWQLLSAFITIQRSNSSLSMRITEAPSSTNRSFLADDISIERVPAAVALGAASGSSVAEVSALQFRAFVTPNPARGAAVLRLSTTKHGPLRVQLFDVSGRVQRVLVDEADAAPGDRTVALRTGERGRIEPGVYFDDFGVRTEINMVVAPRDAAVTGPLQTEILALV